MSLVENARPENQNQKMEDQRPEAWLLNLIMKSQYLYVCSATKICVIV